MVKFLEVENSILGQDKKWVLKTYTLTISDKVVGHATINKDESNRISIYILPKYRGYGYGQFLFDKLMSELQRLKYSKIYVCFSKDNIQMIRILEKRKAMLVATNKEKVKYLIRLTHKNNIEIAKDNSDDER